ncbi:DoxX family protein [Actinomadura barringtoniae]|uniref:DoxX family protein n=2 Tax=Actinomadura barringtoniae TaxID=1427535 RepID=A0A939P768_9ACTN|nr:DoxX family protein [Actinomadura barringtoniae]
MFAVYAVVNVLAALAVAGAAWMDFVRHPVAVGAADTVGTPRSWMYPLGVVLAAGAIGLLAGFVVPPIGTAAAIGLVLYFVCAVGAHLRVRDFKLTAVGTFLALCVAALIVNLARHGLS